MRLYPNPSHLEFVDPVVTGGARAAQTEHAGPQMHHDTKVAVPLLLHGDAAFPGQGVVAETLNLQSLEGYATGGTIHIIQDNQVGFTTDPKDGRSTPYAADMAKGFNVPIIHVNADDVENCIAAIRLAMAYRAKFARDVVIDLIGYRRYGHNETDEPAYTQPEQAAKIKKHPPISELYAKKLVDEGVVTDRRGRGRRRRAARGAQRHPQGAAVEDRGRRVRGPDDHRRHRRARPLEEPRRRDEGLREADPHAERGADHASRTASPSTASSASRSSAGSRSSRTGPIEFAHAEALAFASLLTEGTHIRLTGQDTRRGTFSNRHLVLHDEKTGLTYAPIQNLTGALAPFEIHNSPLSENAALGFEYGYAAASPESLILWEAQFGDFDNSAQVIIDQFIAAGESKWGQTTRLTLLLPHGYEGAGPEHSSARIERFLQLGAEGNMRLANPTHRRPVLPPAPPPGADQEGAADGRLHAEGPAAARRRRLEAQRPDRGHLQVRHRRPERLPAAARRSSASLLCSGRVYHDLEGHDRRADATSVAIARTELIYPFPKSYIAELAAGYPNLEEIVWVQEEPANMGCWPSMRWRLPDAIEADIPVRYVGRPERASPCEGYPAAHRTEQERIVLTALTA